MRRALSFLLAIGLALPAVATLATPAAAAEGLSGIVIDTVGSDGGSISTPVSQLSPTYGVAVALTYGRYYFRTTTSGTTNYYPFVAVTPPTGQTLTAGTSYAVAGTADDTHALVTVATGSGGSCGGSLLSGQLDVLEAVPSGDTFSTVAFRFWLACAGSPNEQYGEVRLASTLDIVSTKTSPLSAAFGNVPAGTTTAPKSVSVTNNGSVPATLGQASFTGSDPSDFAVSSDACSGTTLAVGSSCLLSVTATPEAGNRRAVLTLPDGSARGARAVALIAFGQTPPGAPQSLSTRTASDGVALSWAPPTDTGGSSITGYDVLRGPSADALTVIGHTVLPSYADRVGDTTAADTTYYYAVAAKNALGTGTPSSPVAGTTPTTVVQPTTRQLFTVEGDSASGVAPSRSLLYADTADQPGNVTSPVGCAAGTVCLTGQQSGLPTTYLRLEPPSGTFLAPGTYATSALADATHVGGAITVGSGFVQLYGGTLEVTQAATDASGQVVVLSAELSLPHAHVSIRLGSDEALTAADVTGLDLGSGVVGDTRSGSTTYTNVGDTSVTVSSVAVAPTATGTANDWAVGDDTCTGATVAPGGSCTIGLSVTSTGAGARSADLVVTDSSPAGTHHRFLTSFALGAPSTPASPWATRNSTGTLDVHWTSYDGAATQPASFIVKAGSSPDTLTLIGTVPSTPGSYGYAFTDPSTTNTLRYYAIEATNAAGTSEAATLTVDARLLAPTGVGASPLVGQAAVGWDPAGQYAVGPVSYDVFRGTSASALVKVANVSTPSTVLTGLTAGTTYYVAVATHAGNGAVSPLSTAVPFTAQRTQLVVSTYKSSTNRYGLARRSAVPGTAGSVVVSAEATEDSTEVAVSPNGTRTAYVGARYYPYGDGTEHLWVRPTDGSGSPLQLTSGTDDDEEPAWSQDGVKIAFTRWPSSSTSSVLYVVPASGGTPVAVPNSTNLSSPTWVGPSTLVAEDASSATAPLVRIDANTGARSVVAGSTGGAYPSAKPDGTEVAFVGLGSGTGDVLQVVTLATGAVRSLAVPTNASIGPASWSRDQGTVYFPAYVASATDVFRTPASGATGVTKVTTSTSWIDSVAVSTPDTTAPTVSVAALPTVSPLSALSVRYAGSDLLNGIRRFDVRYTRSTTSGTSAATLLTGSGTTATTFTFKPAPGSRYCFSVRATDRANNTSAWSAPACTYVPYDDRVLTRSGFTAVTGSPYYLGTASTSKTYGATLKTSLTALPLYLVATTCSTCGKVEIRKGTTLLATVSLNSATTVHKRVITLPVKSLSGGITLRVISSSKPVIVDGLVVKTL